MKKALPAVIAIVVVAVIAAVIFMFMNNKPSSVVKLNLAHFFPATHPVEKQLVQKWIAAVQEVTGGSVIVTSYPGETLLNSAEIYNGVASGMADIGISCFAYTRGRFPVLEVFELPGIIYENSKVASMVAWEGIKKLNPKEVQDTHLMMVFCTGPGHLMTRPPVKNLANLRGLQIRATGLSAKTLETLGAVPVAMPQPETYEALSKGLVKGNLAPLEVLQGWRHAEVTEYVTYTPFLYNTLFFMTMNKDVWNKLSKDQQRIINDLNEKFFEEVASSLWDQQNSDALKWAVETTGQKQIQLSKDEAERWIDLIKPIQTEFEKKMDEMGHSGSEIMKTVMELANRYNEAYGK